MTLALVPEEDGDALRESMMDEIGAGAATPVPRERSPHPDYGHHAGITLLIPVPDFMQMAYVSCDDMVAGAWISPTVVDL